MADQQPPAGEKRKRSRWDSDVSKEDEGKKAKVEGDVAPPKPAVKNTSSALEKAKKALELQKALKAKLAAKGIGKAAAPAAPAGGAAAAAIASAIAANPALRGMVGGVPAAGAAGGAPPMAAPPSRQGFRPTALRLNAEGKEVDAEGNLIERKVTSVSTFKYNAKMAKKESMQFPLLDGSEEPQEDAHFDPNMGKTRPRKDRSQFQFVKKGRFERAAENARLRAQFGDEGLKQMRIREAKERRAQEDAAKDGFANANMIPLGTRAGAAGEGGYEEGGEGGPAPVEPIPAVEWWDLPLLKSGRYEDVLAGTLDIPADKITVYVQHPVPIDPPAEAPPPPPQPLKLTRKEQKKLRTQRRVAREKEKQEMIRQGLMEAPMAKVKVSNMMRVLGESATADPTQIEQQVRVAMAERQQAHDDRNLARKLTPAEASDKKLRKLFDESGIDTLVTVYRVGNLTNPQNRFKVDVNAQENHMTGLLVISDAMVFVVVEGGAKAQRRYKKLMLNRIDWDAKLPGEDDEDEDEDDKPPNKCMLVWEGVVKRPNFKKWVVETVRTPAAGRKLLVDAGVGHYWDLAEGVEGW